MLYDDLGFELRWVLDGDDVIMQLVGRVDPGEFMALGLGKNDNISAMVNADAMVTWIDPVTLKGFAVDYHLGDKTPCTSVSTSSSNQASNNGARVRGSCPDVLMSGATDSVTLLHSSIVNGFSMVTFKRPQLGGKRLIFGVPVFGVSIWRLYLFCPDAKSNIDREHWNEMKMKFF